MMDCLFETLLYSVYVYWFTTLLNVITKIGMSSSISTIWGPLYGNSLDVVILFYERDSLLSSMKLNEQIAIERIK